MSARAWSRPLAALCLALGLILALSWPPPGGAGALDEVESEMAMEDIGSGMAAHARGDHDGAIARYTQALASGKLSPENQAVAYNNRGNAFDDKGEAAKALEDYDRAIRLSPAFAEAYFNRAFARHRLGRFQDALDDYARVISLEPNLASAYFNRSFTWAELGQMDKAVADVEKAVLLSPGNSKYLAQLQDWRAALSGGRPR